MLHSEPGPAPIREDKWKREVEKQEGVTRKEKGLMLLSPETLRGLYITGEVYTFCVLWLSMYIIFLIIQCTRLWS